MIHASYSSGEESMKNNFPCSRSNRLLACTQNPKINPCFNPSVPQALSVKPVMSVENFQWVESNNLVFAYLKIVK